MRAAGLGLAGALVVACQGGDGKDTAVGDDDDDDDGTTETTESAWPNSCDGLGPDEPGPEPPTDGQGADFEGFPTYRLMPVGAPRGMFVYFHGGATADEALNPEQMVIFSLMQAEGFGMIATQRTLPGGQDSWDAWDQDLSTNVDMGRVERFMNSSWTELGLREDLPIVTIGFSDGGVMAMSFADVLQQAGYPVIATVVHGGAFQDLAAPLPTILLQGENDYENDALGIVARLTAEGIRTESWTQPERLANPESFLRMWRTDLAEAEVTVADLERAQMIDADSERLVATANIEPAITAWGRATTTPGAAMAEARLRVVWATHRVNAYHVDEECRFVLDSLP